jgi:hypothetical protein
MKKPPLSDGISDGFYAAHVTHEQVAQTMGPNN